MKKALRVAVTGAAGQIGYSILPRLASGQVFGFDQPVILQLIEIEPGMAALQGVAMELQDGAFPLLEGIETTSDLDRGFDGVNWSLLIGSVPRKAGMERKELLGINGKIFVGQGRAIEKNAASDVRILVVGTPCNTICLIAMNNARSIPRDRWFAMMRLDENRAKSQLAQKAGVPWREVTNMAIWGNHSNTQFPDFFNARIGGRPAPDVINDNAWLEGEFIKTVQERGAAIIKARGLSSAFSDWHSVALCSDGSYGIEEGLICGLPVRSNNQQASIVPNLPHNAFARERIDKSVNELKEERAMVADLLPH